MATYPKSAGDQLPAVDWNIVAALAEAAMQGTNNLSEITDIATAWSNLALPFQASDTAGSGFLFVDAGYTAMGTWTGATLTIEGGSLAAAQVDITEGELLIGEDGIVLTDAGYTVRGVLAPGGIDLDEATVRRFTASETAAIVNLEFEPADTAGFTVVDAGYTVLAKFSDDEPNAAEAPPAHSDAEIEHRDAGNKAAAAAMAVQLDGLVARPVWKYNQIIVYGQSLAAGSEGTPTLSRAAKYGSLMLGTKTTSVNNAAPGANNATPPTWEITGSGLNSLVATNGVSAETVLHGAANTYRRLTLTHRGVSADTDHLIVANGAGIGGMPIADLVSGASPNYWNRVPSLMDQVNTAAVAAGGTFGVVGMLWLQGESNQSSSVSTYRTSFDTLITDWQAAAIAESGQADPPAFFTYQTCAPNTNFDNNNMGPPQAQLDAALETDGVFMVGPNYPYPDSNNLHLPSNSYRWLGSQFGKVMFRVLTLGHRWKPLHMRRATRRGLEILVDFHVPHPPLVFENPWLQDGWTTSETATGQTNTQYDPADEGFTVRNTTSAATLTIASVALVSDTQVLITLAAMPGAGTLVVRYADGLHKGHGSVRDSDPTLADDVWEHVTSRTDADTNATLLDARYPLHNWAVAQQITVETL
jgi:hypothetical protein